MFLKHKAFTTFTTCSSRYRYLGTASNKKIIAIRREDKTIWEGRAPFSPDYIRKLINTGIKVIVQPSGRRAYSAHEYISAGASIQEDISEAAVIFGIKEVPIDKLIPDKTFCFFSHTIKAQEYNMAMLDAILEKRIRLIDYEVLISNKEHKNIAFGMAGRAGIIDILHGLGLRLLALGHHTPFMHIGLPHSYKNLFMARQAIRDAGYEIALGHMPKSIGPLTFVFVGSGNVSQGAQEVFRELPHKYVPPTELRKVAEHGELNKVYACVLRRPHYLERIKGGGYDQKEHLEHPERYRSTFSEKYAPYISVIINNIYWTPNSPRLITIEDAKRLLKSTNTSSSSEGSPSLPHRMLAICDVSADLQGAIEFMDEATTIDSPFYFYNADKNKKTHDFSGPGVLVCSIDNMPTQLPRESTEYFGNFLDLFINDILESNAQLPLEKHNFSPAVQAVSNTCESKSLSPRL